MTVEHFIAQSQGRAQTQPGHAKTARGFALGRRLGFVFTGHRNAQPATAERPLQRALFPDHGAGAFRSQRLRITGDQSAVLMPFARQLLQTKIPIAPQTPGDRQHRNHQHDHCRADHTAHQRVHEGVAVIFCPDFQRLPQPAIQRVIADTIGEIEQQRSNCQRAATGQRHQHDLAPVQPVQHRRSVIAVRFRLSLSSIRCVQRRICICAGGRRVCRQ